MPQRNMTPAELIALGISLQIQQIIDDKKSVGRFGVLVTSVTDFDPHALIHEIGNLRRSGRKLRLAISNGYSHEQLESTARDAGFELDEDVFATDLLAAGRWRNMPGIEDVPVVIAPGEQPTLHTLAAFSTISSADVARALLNWASSERNVASNAQHTQLFQALAHPGFAELHNPLNVAKYLSALMRFEPSARLDAIKMLLPHLALLRDPEVFSVSGGLQARLGLNLDLCHRIRYFPKTQQKQVEKRLIQFPDNEQVGLRKTLDIVGKYQRTFAPEYFEALTLQEVYDLLILKPQRAKSQPNTVDKIPDASEMKDEADEQTLERSFAEAVLDADEDVRTQFAETVADSIKQHDPKSDRQQINISVEDAGFESKLKTDDKLLQFVHGFCSEESWGGSFETEHGTLRAAIDLYNQNGVFLNPDEIIEIASDDTSLIELMARLDGCLSTPAIRPAFERYAHERRELLPLIDSIVLAPLVTIGASQERLARFRSYIEAANGLLRALQDNYDTLSAASDKALRICIAYILALDTVLVHVHTDRGSAYKAIVMPLHPLHLWKFVRLIDIYQDRTLDLTPEDREAILMEAESDRHFLHTLYISEVFTDEQRAVALPFAGSISSLPCYENTSNHYSGTDGLNSLFYTLDRFLAFYPLFVRPLRITIVDVPNLSDLLALIAHFLDKHPAERIPTLNVQLFFTEVSASRNYLATLMSGENERIYQELVFTGRLNLQIEADPVTFDEILRHHQRRPVHLIGLFDQSELAVRDFQRQQFFAEDSPFCITREYQYDQVLDEFQVMPVSDEVLFRNYNSLVNRLRRNLSNYSTGVIGRTQTFRQQLDDLLRQNCAQWLFIADRVLPSENRLASPRIYARHEGRREVLVLASTSEHFARELELMLKGFNLYPERAQVEELLLNFSHMVGDGLLSIIQAKDGTLMESKSLGLIGMLVAARAYSQEHPDSLIVAVDNQDARRWLRVTDTKRRADLIGIRLEQDSYVIEAIEVKTYQDEAGLFTRRNGFIEGEAVEQVAAIAAALRQTFDNPQSPLTPPRREVLRDLFYAECQNRRHDREFRARWSNLLDYLFELQALVNIRARIYRIDLSHDQLGEAERFLAEIGQPEPLAIELITLGERQVQRLITGHDLAVNSEQSPFDQEIYDAPDVPSPDPSESYNVMFEGQGAVDSNQEVYSDEIEPSVEQVPSEVWLERVRKSFERSCAAYNIQVVPASLEEVIIGHSIIRFPFRLARGTKKGKLDQSLEDIGREMAISSLTIFTNSRDNSLALDVARPEPVTPLFVEGGRAALPRIQGIHDLPIAVGISPDGQIHITDLREVVHMLIGGTTGAGKTIFLYSVILSLLAHHPLAEDLELVLCTSKLEDFAFFTGLPHLFGRPILTDTDEAIEVIGDIANQELERRSQLLAEQRVRSVEEYNQAVAKEHWLRPIVVIVDEFADLADQVAKNRAARNEFYTNIRRIAQAGRSRSVHLILCTQRPTSDLFPSNIKTLMNARVAFRMNSMIDSRTILDEAGAEKLLGRGDMLFKIEGAIERLQGFFVRTSDIE